MMLNFNQFEALTFDCYGTLIDWESGIWAALDPILRAHGRSLAQEEALELYGGFETEIEAGEYHAYREVLGMVLDAFGQRLGFAPAAPEREAFSASVKDWPPFPDSRRALQALHTKYKLAIISNIDDDLFAYSEE